MTPERFRRLRAVLERRQPDLTVLMEQVHKPHNLSAVVRSADAVGVLEVHAVPAADGLDLVHHTSAGTARWVGVRTHPTVDAAAAHLRRAGFRIWAAHPGPDAVDYRDPDFTRPTALLVGTELHGLSAAALETADGTVRLPQAGMVRSLNVSVATALLLYEAYRQREAAGMYDEPRLEEALRSRLLFEWAHPRVAELCRERDLPYPALDDEGEIVELPAELGGRTGDGPP